MQTATDSAVTIRPAVTAKTLPTVDVLIEPDDSDETIQSIDVFPQSIASGGPTPDGVIIWTRIAPDRFDPSKSLRIEISRDEAFEDMVTRRELRSPGVSTKDNYTVRIDLDGILEPNEVYYYRFGYTGVSSCAGRCRTLPEHDRKLCSLRLGLLNGQDYQNGYFGAMDYLVEEDVDFVLHLGGYIYDYVSHEYPEGEHGPYNDRRIDLPDGKSLPMTLNDFRRIYETYKRDSCLQRLHEHYTVIHTWDDHAIAGDRYWDYDADGPVFPHHPSGSIVEFTRYLTRAGIQAWWEFTPARINYDPNAEHIHDSFELYDVIQFGDLITLLLTDERLFRSRPLSIIEKIRSKKRYDPARTMLGNEQREWFLNEFQDTDRRWTVWANDVMLKRPEQGRWRDIIWITSWEDYKVEQKRIFEAFEDAGRYSDTAIVTLTGDTKSTFATPIRSDRSDRIRIAVELLTPSVTSVDSARSGYSTVEFTPDVCRWEVYWVDKTTSSEIAQSVLQHCIEIPAETYDIHDMCEGPSELSGVPTEDGGQVSPSYTTKQQRSDESV